MIFERFIIILPIYKYLYNEIIINFLYSIDIYTRYTRACFTQYALSHKISVRRKRILFFYCEGFFPKNLNKLYPPV